MRMPDRNTLIQYRTALREQGIAFRLQALYDGSEARTTTEALLSTDQRDALVTAYETGYYDVPRRVSQADLATRFDISPQALSARLRRGTETLIETTLLR